MDEVLSKLGLDGLEDQAGQLVWQKIRTPVIATAAITALAVVLLARALSSGGK